MKETLLYLGLIAVLFVLVMMNNRRNQSRMRDRRNRRFRTNYMEKKRESEKNNENLH